MKLFIPASFFYLATFFVACNGYIYEARVLRKWKKDENRFHYFVGFSDFHDKAHASNDDQRSLIETSLKQLEPSTYAVIVEDLCSANGHEKNSCTSFQIASKGGILAGLGQFCHNHTVPFENVEYRYCRVASMGPVINNLHANPHLFISTRAMKVSSLINEIEQTIEHIGKKVTDPTLKKIYQQEVKKVRVVCDKLRLSKHLDTSIADYLHAALMHKNKLEVLKHLLTFDSGLLDVKLATQVLNSSKEYVLAFAGGTHIRHGCDLLKKVGYEEVKNTALSYTKTPDISSCLGSNIVDGAFCVKPQPLDVKILKNYLEMALP